MKTRNRKRTPVSQKFHTFNTSVPFTPTGPDAAAKLDFIEFYTAARTHLAELKMKRLAVREAQLKKLMGASRKIRPFFQKYLRDEISLDDFASKIKQLVPDMTVVRELMELWTRAERAKPEDVALSKEKIATDEADLRRRNRLLDAEAAITNGIATLTEAAKAGDPGAVSALAQAATNAGLMLHYIESVQPDLIRAVARQQTLWPVIASSETGWQVKAAERVATLDLGADMTWLRVRFRSVRGTDANLPARKWAKAAVRIIEETRFRTQAIAHLIKDFGSSEEFVDYCEKAGWEWGRHPERWKERCSLPPFSRASLPQWKQVIRQMIREDMPDFHTRPEWSNQRNTAQANGRGTVGKIQNAILDDIMSALSLIAPDAELPKSAC